MRAICAFLLLSSAILHTASAQDVSANSTAQEKIIIRLNPAADLQLVRSDNDDSKLQVLSNKEWVLNVNTDKGNTSVERMSVKSGSGHYIPISSDPVNLLSGSPSSSHTQTSKLALNYLPASGSKPENNRYSINLIFTLSNK